MATTWRTWIKQAGGGNTYFLLNKLAQPDPVVQFYAADWVEESYPLYAGTSLSHLREQGPWLVNQYLFDLDLMLSDTLLPTLLTPEGITALRRYKNETKNH